MQAERPDIARSASIAEYVQAMIQWRKATDRSFSVRRRAAEAGDISPALVTQISQGRRQLTRERVEPLAKLLGLTRSERAALDRKVEQARSTASSAPSKARLRRSAPDNSILSDWLHLYIKDAAQMPGFDENPAWIKKQLGLAVPERRIARCLRFLVSHGHLRRDLKGKLTPQEPISQTTNGVPSAKIRAFHKNALKIASRSIDRFPVHDRRAHTLLMALTAERSRELDELLGEFYERLIQFMENADDSEGAKPSALYQIILNLCPISPGAPR
jgi:uncharacterized protein (TIGR02147 family)